MGRSGRGVWSESVVRAKRTQPKNAKVAQLIAPRTKTSQKKAPPKRVAKKIDGDPIESILKKIAEMEQVGIDEIEEQDILMASGYSSRDSKGFRKLYQELAKELGYVTRSTKKKKCLYTLTDKGRCHLMTSGLLVVAAEPKTKEEHLAQLKEKLEKLVSAPKNKLESFFHKLEDGDWHSIQDLVAASGYGSPDSKGYRSIMSSMKKLDLIEKSGKKFRLNETAFKFGRPQGD